MNFLEYLVVLLSLHVFVWVKAASFHREQCDIDAHGVCFVVSQDVASWEDAQSQCQEMGGNLAILEKSPLRKAVDQLFPIGVPLWIGLSELEVETHPYWVNGEKLGKHGRLKHYPWNDDDQNSEDDDCVLAVPDIENERLLWQYANCQSANRYLCGISDLDETAKEQLKEEKDAKEAVRQAELNSTFAIIEEQNKHVDIGNSKMIEGDIILSPEQREVMDDGSARKRGVHLNSNYFWPNGVVYYEYEPNVFTDTEIAMIVSAMDVIRDATCIDFIERQQENDYVYIVKNSGCYSYIGRISGRQDLSLGIGCLYYIGVPIHEFLHALGFYHEQSRPDRDNYVEINFDNVQTDRTHNFNIRDMNTQNTIYDYGSIMHYGRYAFAANRSIPTITVKQETDYDVYVGQRNGLSSLDTYELNKIYNCAVPVDGNWSPWSTWSQCPVTCGGSTQTRTRQCNSPPPSVSPVGQPCPGSGTDTRTCMDVPCPGNLNYTWLGCYWDDGDGELLTSLENTGNSYLIGHYLDRQDPVRQCAAAASHIWHDIFALRFGGKCYSMNSEEDGTLYQEGGVSNQCYYGLGTTESLDVYSVETSTGNWGEWSQWSTCSFSPSSPSCLGGVMRGRRTRSRDCESVQMCEGTRVEREDCQETCQSQDKWICVGPDLYVFIVGTTMSWEGARTHCQNLDTDYQADLAVLADVSTRTQAQNFIATASGLQNPPGQGYWIGCNDIEEEGTFVWVSGASVDMATAGWWRKEPNNKSRRCSITGQDCCQLWKKRGTRVSNYNLDDDCCHKEKSFLCQVEDYCNWL